ncbi:hypothetical protein [Streptomyces sp. NPDC003077]|uniref:hypothetical protein n=1 Tax=Streptomyces sp. NPDC003077 TaxID=3154443 RepID=UPI0033B9981F
MSLICNQPRQPGNGTNSVRDMYERVDAPIATGSAHLMRAGAELHLILADLEMNDPAQAAMRVTSVSAAVHAALAEYEESHRVAGELGFYSVHDTLLKTAGGGSFQVRAILDEAHEKGLVDLDEASVAALGERYVTGGDEKVFTEFIAELRVFSTEIDNFARATTTVDDSTWREFPWKAITHFDRIRVQGQAIAIVNILGTAHVTVAVQA